MKKSISLTLTAIALGLISNSLLAKSNGIENLSKASEGVFRGARPLNLDEMKSLDYMGIKSILNLQGRDLEGSFGKIVVLQEPGEKPEMISAEKSVTETLGMQFKNIPLNSFKEVDDKEDKDIDAALEYMHESKNQPVYIHCEHGKDRTGLLVALYKVKYDGMDVDAAYSEWIELGHDKKAQILTHELDTYFFKKVQQINKSL
jgi:tyrosine-protein phosphatase SIW14